MDVAPSECGRLPSGLYAAVVDVLRTTLASVLAEEDDDVLQFTIGLTQQITKHQQTWAECRGNPVQERPEVTEPWRQFTSGAFYRMTGWAPDDFLEMTTQFERLPKIIKTEDRRVFTRPFGIFVLLARWTGIFASWDALARQLGTTRTKLVNIFGAIGTMIYSEPAYQTLSTKIDVPRLYHRVPEFATAVRDKGGLLEEEVIGLVDCSGIGCCRPGKKAAAKRKFSTVDVQKYAYSAAMKKGTGHGLSLQNVLLVDGIAVVFVSLVADHDARVLRESGILEQLRDLRLLLERDPDPAYHNHKMIVIYGDPAYPKLDVVARKSKGVRSDKDKLLDRSMQPNRATVEDWFQYLFLQFPYFKRPEKFQFFRVAQFSIVQQLVVVNLFLNLRTCAYGNQVNSFFFGVDAPSMSEYMESANSGTLLSYYDV